MSIANAEKGEKHMPEGTGSESAGIKLPPGEIPGEGSPFFEGKLQEARRGLQGQILNAGVAREDQENLAKTQGSKPTDSAKRPEGEKGWTGLPVSKPWSKESAQANPTADRKGGWAGQRTPFDYETPKGQAKIAEAKARREQELSAGAHSESSQGPTAEQIAKSKEFLRGKFNRENLSFAERKKVFAQMNDELGNQRLTPEQRKEKAWEEEKARARALKKKSGEFLRGQFQREAPDIDRKAAAAETTARLYPKTPEQLRDEAADEARAAKAKAQAKSDLAEAAKPATPTPAPETPASKAASVVPSSAPEQKQPSQEAKPVEAPAPAEKPAKTVVPQATETVKRPIDVIYESQAKTYEELMQKPVAEMTYDELKVTRDKLLEKFPDPNNRYKYSLEAENKANQLLKERFGKGKKDFNPFRDVSPRISLETSFASLKEIYDKWEADQKKAVSQPAAPEASALTAATKVATSMEKTPEEIKLQQLNEKAQELLKTLPKITQIRMVSKVNRATQKEISEMPEEERAGFSDKKSVAYIQLHVENLQKAFDEYNNAKKEKKSPFGKVRELLKKKPKETPDAGPKPESPAAPAEPSTAPTGEQPAATETAAPVKSLDQRVTEALENAKTVRSDEMKEALRALDDELEGNKTLTPEQKKALQEQVKSARWGQASSGPTVSGQAPDQVINTTATEQPTPAPATPVVAETSISVSPTRAEDTVEILGGIGQGKEGEKQRSTGLVDVRGRPLSSGELNAAAAVVEPASVPAAALESSVAATEAGEGADEAQRRIAEILAKDPNAPAVESPTLAPATAGITESVIATPVVPEQPAIVETGGQSPAQPEPAPAPAPAEALGVEVPASTGTPEPTAPVVPVEQPAILTPEKKPSWLRRVGARFGIGKGKNPAPATTVTPVVEPPVVPPAASEVNPAGINDNLGAQTPAGESEPRAPTPVESLEVVGQTGQSAITETTLSVEPVKPADLPEPGEKLEPAPVFPAEAEPTPEEKIRAAEEAVEIAGKTKSESFRQYDELLKRDEAFILANKAFLKSYEIYSNAFQESKLGEKAFQATPSGKELCDAWFKLYLAQENAKEAFQATPEGKKLNEEWWRDYMAYGEAKKVLEQAKAELDFSKSPVSKPLKQ